MSAKKYAIVRQHDRSDCGVACLLSLLRYYGGDGSLEQLRKQSGTGRQGTTLLGLYQAAQAAGFDAEGCEADIPALIEHGRPIILHVLAEGNLEHYVVCYGYEEGRFVIGDPAKGMVSLTEKELETIWRSRTCLTLTPNGKFKTKTETGAEKRKWMYELIREDIGLLCIQQSHHQLFLRSVAAPACQFFRYPKDRRTDCATEQNISN